jgi:hypothetical protein
MATAAAITPMSGRARVHAPLLALQLHVERLQVAEPARQALDLQLVDVLGLVDVLHPPDAEVPDRDPGRQVLLDDLLRRRREQDLAAVAGGADPRSAVHADAHVALLAYPGLARVQSHAHLDVDVLRPPARGEIALCVHSRCDRLGGGAEGDEEGVALRVHDASAVGGEGGAQEASVLGEQLVVPVAAEVLEQRGRAFDVREEEGDGSARELAQGQSVLRRPDGNRVKRPPHPNR